MGSVMNLHSQKVLSYGWAWGLGLTTVGSIKIEQCIICCICSSRQHTAIKTVEL